MIAVLLIMAHRVNPTGHRRVYLNRHAAGRPRFAIGLGVGDHRKS